jgi:hypothetical protein
MSAYPVEYNGTIATGGDSLTEDLNMFYSVRSYYSAYHTQPVELSTNNDNVVWRYRMGNHLISPCAAYDSWSWV